MAFLRFRITFAAGGFPKAISVNEGVWQSEIFFNDLFATGFD